jgi:hypothetical protein
MCRLIRKVIIAILVHNHGNPETNVILETTENGPHSNAVCEATNQTLS